MNRIRLLSGLLALILLGCGAVIFLDQRGAFGGGTAGHPGVSTPANPGTPLPSSGDGYGDLR